MKQKFMAAAAMGILAGAAQAQSSVTIYGSVDGGIRYLTNTNAAGDDVIVMSNGITASGTSLSNRLGFKGIEDLGGGMNAHYVLESGFVLGRGAFTGAAGSQTLFSRQSFVGLGGTWGSVDFGRQYSVALKQLGSYDPFMYKFPTIVPLAFAASADPSSGGRFNNDIQYTGTFGPITARAEYVLGEVSGGTSNNASKAVGLHYQSGAISAGGAFTRRKPLVGAVYENNDQWLVGGAYTVGPFRVATGYIDEQQDVGAGEAKIRNAWFGGSYNITSAVKLTGGFYRTKNTSVSGTDGKRDLFIASATYALSQRTELYLEVDRARFTSGFSNQYTASPIGLPGGNAAGVGANGHLSQNGISIGMTHTF